MFEKILIANRGEIACRVIRTARRMGIRTVAVYSDADTGARHVRLADEAVAIGPAPATASYLEIGHILAAAARSGAQAIHPGYGFLSENAQFAQACADAGIVFIGPPPAAIRAMGRKSDSKALLEKAGVPLVPGYHGADQDPERLAREAAAIGYPVLIKASAGGGGKGMRRVDAPGDFAAALAACRREARSAFGDDDVLVEKYVLRPRHIELQVFADTHGHCIHLFERDCSVQRRHQKVMEEAPAPGMTPQRRAAMGEAAVQAARAVGYVGAGTVEFIVAPDGSFHFMEMNTRLQVEHPVTEMITGLDLVEWQLRVAAGEPLPLRQEQVAIDGHAIEVRIYAEDPDRGFLPSTGRLELLVPPVEDASVRVDTGVEAGDEITPHYDPMIAKLIARGADRPEALGRLRQALGQYRIAGVANNVGFLSRLVRTPSVVAAELDTSLIEREHDLLFPPPAPLPDIGWWLVAWAEFLRDTARSPCTDGASPPQEPSPWQARDGWRLNGPAVQIVLLRCGETVREFAIETHADGHRLVAGGRRIAVSGAFDAQGRLHATVDGQDCEAEIHARADRRHLYLDGQAWTLSREPATQSGVSGEDSAGGLRAPMPGKVVALLVEVGARVEAGSPLLVLETMKMEHALNAPHAGVVRALHCAVGDQVSDGRDLLELEAAP